MPSWSVPSVLYSLCHTACFLNLGWEKLGCLAEAVKIWPGKDCRQTLYSPRGVQEKWSDHNPEYKVGFVNGLLKKATFFQFFSMWTKQFRSLGLGKQFLLKNLPAKKLSFWTLMFLSYKKWIFQHYHHPFFPQTDEGLLYQQWFVEGLPTRKGQEDPNPSWILSK